MINPHFRLRHSWRSNLEHQILGRLTRPIVPDNTVVERHFYHLFALNLQLLLRHLEATDFVSGFERLLILVVKTFRRAPMQVHGARRRQVAQIWDRHVQTKLIGIECRVERVFGKFRVCARRRERFYRIANIDECPGRLHRNLSSLNPISDLSPPSVKRFEEVFTHLPQGQLLASTAFTDPEHLAFQFHHTAIGLSTAPNDGDFIFVLQVGRTGNDDMNVCQIRVDPSLLIGLIHQWLW
ncbi:hypothetical protein D3C77_259570 [compost metagenome]